MARRAKDSIIQQQHSALPTDPRVLSNNANSFGLPQMLPSPGPSFSLLFFQAGPSNSNPSPTRTHQTGSLPTPPPSVTMEIQRWLLCCVHLRVLALLLRASSPGKYRECFKQDEWLRKIGTRMWSANRETDWDRDRNGNYTSGSSGRCGRRHHDPDERYGSHYHGQSRVWAVDWRMESDDFYLAFFLTTHLFSVRILNLLYHPTI